MININPNYVASLQCRLKVANARIEKFESGKAYNELKYRKDMQRKEYETQLRKRDKKNDRLQKENKKLRKEIKELNNMLAKQKYILEKQSQKEKCELYEIINKEASVSADLRDKYKSVSQENKKLKGELEKIEGQNKKMKATLNKDFENSSIPSSLQGPKRKKIPNTRTPSDKPCGAQVGHPHYGRKKLKPDEIIVLDKSDKLFEADPDLYKTSHTISKQVVEASVDVRVIEYRADVWRSRKTGKRVHTPFPDGIKDDVTYDGSVKALIFMLTNECCVSSLKAKQFLYEASEKRLDISEGMIRGLSAKFSKRTEEEKRDAYLSMISGKVLHADFTQANVNGKAAQVLVLANEGASVMVAKKNKGHKGIKDTVLSKYAGCVVHDHDTTFYSYGINHQECMQHNIRYLIASIQNEGHLRWNKEMLELIREMIHAKNKSVAFKLDKETSAEFRDRYDSILNLAQKEYEMYPPSKYYKEGYNLYKRLRKYKNSELAFLDNANIPADNSVCERLARVFKRKQHQAIVFRSFESLGHICESIYIINNMRKANKNVFEELSAIFNRQVGCT